MAMYSGDSPHEVVLSVRGMTGTEPPLHVLRTDPCFLLGDPDTYSGLPLGDLDADTDPLGDLDGDTDPPLGDLDADTDPLGDLDADTDPLGDLDGDTDPPLGDLDTEKGLE